MINNEHEQQTQAVSDSTQQQQIIVRTASGGEEGMRSDVSRWLKERWGRLRVVEEWVRRAAERFTYRKGGERWRMMAEGMGMAGREALL